MRPLTWRTCTASDYIVDYWSEQTGDEVAGEVQFAIKAAMVRASACVRVSCERAVQIIAVIGLNLRGLAGENRGS